MDPILMVLLMCGGSALAAHKFNGDKKDDGYGVLTPQLDNLFKAMMRSQKSPELFDQAAQQFEARGLKIQAEYLRKRAAARRMTAEQKEARRQVAMKVFQSTDPTIVDQGADIFEKEGQTRLAGKMRHYAKTLRKAEQAGITVLQGGGNQEKKSA